MNARVVVATLAGMLAALPALAQTKTGTTVGQFMLIEPSARNAAMGNAGSVASGLDAAYYNPAAIGTLGGYGVQFTHSPWLASITFDYAAVSIPAGKWGNLLASVTALNSGEIDVRTVDQPLGTGERFSVTDLAIGIGYGRKITDRFCAGLQFNLMQETIWHSSLRTAVLNIGTLYQVSENGLRIGASLANFGTQGTYSGRDLRITADNDPNRYGDNGALPAELHTDPFDVPVLFRAGVGMPFRLSPLTRLDLAVEALHPNDNAESVSAGAEVEYSKMLALRLGYQNALLKDSEVGLTAGGGVMGTLDVYHYRVDYAWADHGRLGDTHRLSFVVTF